MSKTNKASATTLIKGKYYKAINGSLVKYLGCGLFRFNGVVIESFTLFDFILTQERKAENQATK